MCHLISGVTLLFAIKNEEKKTFFVEPGISGEMSSTRTVCTYIRMRCTSDMETLNERRETEG